MAIRKGTHQKNYPDVAIDHKILRDLVLGLGCDN